MIVGDDETGSISRSNQRIAEFVVRILDWRECITTSRNNVSPLSVLPEAISMIEWKQNSASVVNGREDHISDEWELPLHFLPGPTILLLSQR